MGAGYMYMYMYMYVYVIGKVGKKYGLGFESVYPYQLTSLTVRPHHSNSPCFYRFSFLNPVRLLTNFLPVRPHLYLVLSYTMGDPGFLFLKYYYYGLLVSYILKPILCHTILYSEVCIVCFFFNFSLLLRTAVSHLLSTFLCRCYLSFQSCLASLITCTVLYSVFKTYYCYNAILVKYLTR